ncbi:MAG: hypothetical protein A2Z21_01685 [Candidatus Fraserbacteria bacterium RBG_16_55_9]|uniref:Uncharacterized protein n=1 Tax=Fraserbacteria sp. (strain RBG_16_55_9) TaxID=1817864 RepID=A0A1F5UY01_FRAXR|nr:MAG: hypothetical protein A2Z21_01685 [Candidatus Fraserbacteria bacterium RBG_16_55_9]
MDPIPFSDQLWHAQGKQGRANGLGQNLRWVPVAVVKERTLKPPFAFGPTQKDPENRQCFTICNMRDNLADRDGIRPRPHVDVFLLYPLQCVRYI